MNAKMKILSLTMLMVIVAVTCFATASLVDQKGVLTGTVVANQLVTEGTAVQVGTPLVFIETPVGPVPATRANTNGIVRQVLVHPGDMINTGDVLVRIEPVQRK